LRRAARWTGRGLLWSVLGLVLLLGAVLVALQLPPVSQLVIGRVNAALAESFRGQLLLRRLGFVDLGGISGAELEVRDAEGRPVLLARGVDVRLAWPALAVRAVLGSDPLRVTLQRVSLEGVEVTLIDDGTGTPTLAHAFEPRTVEPEDPSAGSTVLLLRQLTLGAAHIGGELAGLGPVDADLRELRARLASDAAGLTLVLEQLEVAARQLPTVQSVSGRLSAEVHLPAEASAPSSAASPSTVASGITTETRALRVPPEPQKVVLDFAGDVAGSGAAANVRLEGEQLQARLDAPQLTPATLTQLLPGLLPSAPVALLAELEGPLERLELKAQLQQAKARVVASGQLRRENERNQLRVRVEASDVDLAQLLPDVPPTRIALLANADLDAGEAGSKGHYRVVSQESLIAGQAVPPTIVEGELGLPEQEPLYTKGTLTLAEPGANTRVDYRVTSGPAGSSAQLFATLELDRPRRLREQLGLATRGKVELRADLDTGADQLDARVAVKLRDVRHEAARAARVDAQLSARGRWSAPELQLRGDVRSLEAAGRVLQHLRLDASGTPERIQLDVHATGPDPERLELSATLEPNSRRQVLSPRLRVWNRGERVQLQARSVGASGGQVQLDRLTLDGVGKAEVSLRYGQGLEQLDLSTQGLDAARLLRALGVQTPLQSAQADLTAQVSGRGRALRGKLSGDVHDIAFAELRGSLHTDLTLERERLNGEARFDLTPGGSTLISLRELALPRGALDAEALDHMQGELALRGELKLGCVQSLLQLLGVERGEGTLRYDVALGGGAGAENPGLRAHLETRSLVLVGKRPDVGQTSDAEVARRTAPWSVRDMDLTLDAQLAKGQAELTGKLFDGKGDLLKWQASLRGLPQRVALPALRQALPDAPLEALIELPRRSLEELPAMLRPNDIEGTLALRVQAEGTLREPRVSVTGALGSFTPASERRRKNHLDVNLDAEYAPEGGRVALTALRRHIDPVLELDSHWQGDLRQLGGASPEQSPIQADTELRLSDFPMAMVPLLQQQRVRGRLTGSARLLGLGKDARMDVDMHTRELKVERLPVGEVRALLRTVGNQLQLETSIDGESGKASVRLNAPLVWGARLVPSMEGKLSGSVEAHELQLAALGPLVEGSVSELDGKLDANLQASLEGDQTRVTGRATLREGVLHMPSVGQRFSDISAELSVSPGSLRIDKLKARGMSGGFEASAQAKLDGLSPSSAEAELRIKEDQQLPLTVEGESLGDVWGTVKASYRRDESSVTNTVNVKLEKLHITLPEAPPQGLQSLDQPDNIRVGYRRRDGEFTPIALQLLEEQGPPSEEKTVVLVELASVSVQKGDQANVDLGGKLQATLGEELDVQGKIETRRGQLDISGKTFDIERASVAFTGGEPDDPTIGAVARYDSPAGYEVYAEYTGTVSKGKLALRAEPALSQDEIVTLLLFGTPDGSLGASGGDSLSTAVSVAGGTAAQGFNRAISGLTNLDVSARVDTSTGAPRPELVLQLTPRVAAKVTQALGEPVPGQSPDRTFVTVDLRLANNWSLSTMVGDRGASAFDLIWRRRY
jgi:translocation and assembly module TamB